MTFDRGERLAVACSAVEAAKAGHRTLPVNVAVSAAAIGDVARLAKDAEAAGAGGLLLTLLLSYLPPSDVDVRSLSGAAAEAAGLPICFYNQPVPTHNTTSARRRRRCLQQVRM